VSLKVKSEQPFSLWVRKRSCGVVRASGGRPRRAPNALPRRLSCSHFRQPKFTWDSRRFPAKIAPLRALGGSRGRGNPGPSALASALDCHARPWRGGLAMTAKNGWIQCPVVLRRLIGQGLDVCESDSLRGEEPHRRCPILWLPAIMRTAEVGDLSRRGPRYRVKYHEIVVRADGAAGIPLLSSGRPAPPVDGLGMRPARIRGLITEGMAPIRRAGSGPLRLESFPAAAPAALVTRAMGRSPCRPDVRVS